MQVKVDAELCTGCGVCVDACPEVFDMKDDVAVAIVNPVPEEFEESCQEAADDCPCDAIVID